jgi:rhomboid protease GluP
VIYELGLISVVVGAGYWGWFFVRHRPHGSATFGLMQIAAAVLAALGVLGQRLDIAWLGVPGAIGLGGGACMLLIGPLARGLARRMVVAERMRLATRLLDLAELLAPGSGVAEEKALVRAMSEIREGKIEHTVDALTAARERVPAKDRLAIDERIAMLYLGADRWGDAIAYAEAHLFGAPAPPEDGSLRRALGVAPPVWVDLLGAYGRTGDLDQAARMLVRLEDACAGREDTALWQHRGRMMFLALAGRTEAVRALVAPRQSRHMSTAARGYWIGVSHQHRGDRAAAATAYEKARSRSRGRLRDLIDRALAGLGDSRPAALNPTASEIVARVEAAPLPPLVRIGARGPRVRASWLVAALIVAVPAATAIAVGDSSDLGTLIRAGGLARDLVAAGEWWRLVSCLFVHIGVLHLALNAFGLIVLGRLAEDVFGGARMIAIFAGAGLAGSIASYAWSPVGLSAGASGAVFGLLGAVFTELTWHRARYRQAWKRGLWGALVVITVGQLGYGAFTDVFDQWAHGAGLAAGAVLGFALSPGARWAAVGNHAARAIAIGFGAACAIVAVLVATTSIADSLARGGLRRHVVDGIALEAPARWRDAADLAVTSGGPRVAQVAMPDGLVAFTLARDARSAPVEQLAAWIAAEGRRVKQELGDVGPATGALIGLPAGWEGSELVAVAPEDPMGYRQRWRFVVCGRAFGDQTIFVAIEVPETIAAAAPEFFARLLASIGPA